MRSNHSARLCHLIYKTFKIAKHPIFRSHLSMKADHNIFLFPMRTDLISECSAAEKSIHLNPAFKISILKPCFVYTHFDIRIRRQAFADCRKILFVNIITVKKRTVHIRRNLLFHFCNEGFHLLLFSFFPPENEYSATKIPPFRMSSTNHPQR